MNEKESLQPARMRSRRDTKEHQRVHELLKENTPTLSPCEQPQSIPNSDVQ